MSDVFLRVVATISGSVLAAVWGIALLVWLKTSPPKAHPVWLAGLALGYALIAIPLYMGHGILILLAGQILVFLQGTPALQRQ